VKEGERKRGRRGKRKEKKNEEEHGTQKA